MIFNKKKQWGALHPIVLHIFRPRPDRMLALVDSTPATLDSRDCNLIPNESSSACIDAVEFFID